MKSFLKFLAETTFYARRTHPVQTKTVKTKSGRKFQTGRSKDSAPRPSGKWTRAKSQRKLRRVSSSSEKAPISKSEVEDAKNYLRVHDLALESKDKLIPALVSSFKDYLDEQN